MNPIGTDRHAEERERKRHKERYGMKVSGRSTKSVLLPVIEKKARWATKLSHPSYAIEPCPNCGFPEADGGYCEECGWTRAKKR